MPSKDVAGQHANVDYVRSEANLGGAGGFSLAILKAVASGADWIWMMDDDAEPADPECLATLLREAQDRDLDAVVPLVVAPGHPDQLSFFFRLDGKVTHERAEVEKVGFLPDDGHFFNGALIRSDVFFKVGLPDMRLFIRGDEVDFTLRLRKAGIRFGTVTTAAITPPACLRRNQARLRRAVARDRSGFRLQALLLLPEPRLHDPPPLPGQVLHRGRGRLPRLLPAQRRLPRAG